MEAKVSLPQESPIDCSDILAKAMLDLNIREVIIKTLKRYII